MTVQKNLLIAAPLLQNLLVDKAGNPLVNGVITLTQDTSRLTLKNWYYETGSPGSYNFVALDNPLTLSAAGTIQDPTGADTIPFFYPYDETSSSTTPPVQKYYITVDDSNGSRQFDRQDFPYDLSTNATPSGGGSGGAGAAFENLVINNEFWRNAGKIVDPFKTTNTAPVILAASQHDSYRFSDIEYIVVGTGDTETVSFVKFSGPGQMLTGDITPEYYLDFNCTVSTTGETSKIISIPLSTHLLTLAGFQGATFTVQANVQSGTSNLEVNIVGDYGSNGLAQIVQHLGTIVLNSSWTKYTFPFNFPNIVAGNISATADDGWYLQFVLPNTATHIQIAKPSVFLSATVPTNDFMTYDQIDSVISSPRTGDVRTSLNTFAPFGWVLCNDGLISNTGAAAPATPPIARQDADTWPLFNLLWPLNGTIVYNNVGPTAKGASAYADFVTNGLLMGLPLMLGRALLGLPPAVTCTYNHTTTPSWNQTSYNGAPAAVAGVFTLSGAVTNTLLYPGAPVYLTGTLPVAGAFTANTIYYLIPNPTTTLTAGTTFQLATTYARAINAQAIAAVGASDGGTITLNFALANAFGEGSHLPVAAELFAHNHTPSIPGQNFLVSGAGTGAASGVDIQQDGITSTAGKSNFYNMLSPSTWLNVFFKL